MQRRRPKKNMNFQLLDAESLSRTGNKKRHLNKCAKPTPTPKEARIEQTPAEKHWVCTKCHKKYCHKNNCCRHVKVCGNKNFKTN